MSTTLAPDQVATEKQLGFLSRLLEDRDLSMIPDLAESIRTAQSEGMTKQSASAAIDSLMSLPRKPITHDDGNVLSEGYYLQEDTVYRVVKAKSSGNLYAKALVTTSYGSARYEYAPGAMRHLVHAPRLTVEQAAEMGVKHGICVVCGATLTDPDSVARGIGPVCAARL